LSLVRNGPRSPWMLTGSKPSKVRSSNCWAIPKEAVNETEPVPRDFASAQPVVDHRLLDVERGQRSDSPFTAVGRSVSRGESG
jgi:hypothetical protein